MKKNSKWVEKLVAFALMVGMVFGLIAPVGIVSASTPAGIDLNIEQAPLADPVPWNLWSWGDNFYGQLGTPSSGSCAGSSCSTTPLRVSGPSGLDIIAIESGADHSLALMSDGTVWAWGSNEWRQLGTDSADTCKFTNNTKTYPCSKTPLQVAGLSNVIAISAGNAFNLALTSDGTVYGWGMNITGQTGVITTDKCNSVVSGLQYSCVKTPTQIPSFDHITAISAGYSHSLALKDDATVWAWGWNDFSTLGAVTNTYCEYKDKCSQTPILVQGIDHVTAIEAGGADSLAIKDDGTVWAWGINNHGQLGTTSTETCQWSDDLLYYPCGKTPKQVDNLSGVIGLASSDYGGINKDTSYGFSLALKEDGTVWSWGPNDFGQLGVGDTVERVAPVQVSGLSGVEKIAAGYFHGLAMKDDNTVWSWGKNEYGQLGIDSTTQQLTPQIIIAVSRIPLEMAAGARHSLLYTNDTRTYSIIGTVTDKLNNPFPGVTVTFDGSTPPATGISGSDGVYKLAGFLEGTAGQLSAAKAGFLFTGPLSIAALNGSLTGKNFKCTDAAPVAVDDSYHTTIDIPLNVAAPGVIGNDTDADLDPLLPTVVTEPDHGSLILDSDGSFSYTPSAGYHGPDSFTYKVNDGMLDSSVATVNLIVNIVPVAADDTGDAYTVDEDHDLVVTTPGILSNDTDGDGNPLTAVKATDPINGTLTLNSDGSFTYTPNQNFNGTDSFTYFANDGLNDSPVATVTIEINSINDAPEARNDRYKTNWATVLNVPAPGVMSNDTDVEGSQLTATLVSDVSVGALNFHDDGSFSYTPKLNTIVDDSFTYQASDGLDSSTIATVTIHVTELNRAPVARGEYYTSMVDELLVVPAPGLLANDSDPDEDALTVVKVSDPEHGVLALNPDGSFTYTPNLDFSGVDSFTYQADDSQVISRPATVVIVVNRDPRAPTAVSDIYSLKEDTVKTVLNPGLLRNDKDPAGKKIKATLIEPPAHGALQVFRSDGYFRYMPDRNFNGTDSFTYRVSNGTLNSNIARVILIVTSVNDRPVAVADTASVEMNTTLSVAAPGVLANDFDVDRDLLQILLASKPYHGTVTLNQDGSFVYIPKVNYAGSDYFTYKISDGITTSIVVPVKITVTQPTYAFTGFLSPVSNPPTLNQVPAGSRVPVRFSLGGDRGMIISPNSSPSSIQVSCNKAWPVVNIAETKSDPAGLTYDTATEQYTYVWATSAGWKNTCRKFSYRLNDGTTHTALFKFQ